MSDFSIVEAQGIRKVFPSMTSPDRVEAPASASSQVPLAAQPSFGWAQGPAEGRAMPIPSSFGGRPAVWPPSPGPGPQGFPGMPMMQASYQGDVEMPQPFPGPVPMPLEQPQFYSGYRDRLEIKLQHKNRQIARILRGWDQFDPNR